MTITPLYAGLLAILLLVLSYRVVAMRGGPNGPSLGDGGNPVMLRRIRGQANFTEYVPIILLMIGFLEVSGWPAWVLHALGASLLVARLLHGYALSFTTSFKFGRMAGAGLTFLLLLAGGVLCIWQAVQPHAAA